MSKIKLSTVVVLLLLLGNSSNAIEMTDYKIIEGTYQESYINGQLSVESGNQDQTSYKAHADASTKNIYTTAPFSWELSGQFNVDSSKGPNDGDSDENSYDGTLSSRVDKYLKNDDTYFVYGGLDLGYRKQVTADDADDPFAKISAGAGYGRMYDATPLAVALRIVEDLTKYKVINKPLSDKGYIALAKVIDLKEEYKSKYSEIEYKKYWYEDMEKALKKEGVLSSDALGAFGIVRINEIIDLEKISGRFHGWKVRAGLGQIVSNYNGKSENATVDGEFDYGLPIGYESQFRETATISKILDDNAEIDYQFNNNMSYTYEVSDRIDWENNWALSMDAYNEGDNVITNTLSTGFGYYLANRLKFSATLSLTKTDGTNGGSVETPDWDTTFFTGLTYRLK